MRFGFEYGNEGKVKTPYLVSAVSACNGTTALVIDTMSPQLHGGDFVEIGPEAITSRERDSSCLLTVER